MTEKQDNYKPLLPCPFCGGVAIVVPAAAIGVWRAGCAGRRGCTVEPSIYAPTLDEAVERWNTRKGEK